MTSEATKTTEKVQVKEKAQPKKMYGRTKARVQKGLVYGAAVITFAVLLFLIAYILINGIPNLKLSLFEWTYNSDNVSMMPAIITTVEMTLLALVIAVPLGLFTAIYLNEYAQRGNKLVNIIRITTETLSGIRGIGYASYNSMVQGDIPFTMFYLAFIAILTLLGNLISDILYAVVDPRVRLS